MINGWKQLLLLLACGGCLQADAAEPSCSTPAAKQAATAQRVVTEFAVPVAVPVAPYAPVWYGYTLHSPDPPADDALAERVAEKLATRLKLGPPTAGLPTPAKPLAPAVAEAAQRCLRCHAGAKPAGDFNLEHFEQLAPDRRLLAVQAIVSEKMPPDAPALSAAEAGRLILELSKALPGH
ncbi:MAG TPA: hypothetical protein VFE24_15100 [Pirellulales bacterium]|jgi:hypothetical protein|nr:hypothetical protein [Pirellulales bacterium]